MSEARPQPNEAQWLVHKSFIRQEYLFRDTSLKKLVEILAIRGLQITYAESGNSDYLIGANLTAARHN